MNVLLLTVAPESRELALAELYALETEGIVEEDLASGEVLLQAFFAQPFDVDRFASWRPRWRQAETRDWVAEFERSWEALAAGERFWLVPHWRRDTEAVPEGRVPLTVYPGLACGTGRHPTTQLCLAAMERFLAPGARVIDVGTGSGILCAAAALLGAGSIAGCDIDPDAVEIAAENLSKEGVAAGLWIGSLRSVRDGAADVLLANINAEGVRALAGEIRRTLASGGVAVLSGFPPADHDRALEAFGPARPLQGFVIVEERTLDGWMALALRREF